MISVVLTATAIVLLLLALDLGTGSGATMPTVCLLTTTIVECTELVAEASAWAETVITSFLSPPPPPPPRTVDDVGARDGDGDGLGLGLGEDDDVGVLPHIIIPENSNIAVRTKAMSTK